jgi:hypothetical protein
MLMSIASVVVQNESRYYYVLVQAQVERKKIRVPEGLGMQVFIINDSMAIH